MRETHDAIEYAITQYLEHALPPDALAFHIPNEGQRGGRAQAEFKRSGGRAGVFDRCILWNGKAHFLETKPRGGRLSPEQEEFLVLLEAAGCEGAVVRSVEDVEAELSGWGIPIRARLKPA